MRMNNLQQVNLFYHRFIKNTVAMFWSLNYVFIARTERDAYYTIC